MVEPVRDHDAAPGVGGDVGGEVELPLLLALAAKGQLEEAILHLKQVVEASPEMTGARVNLAQALSDHGRNEEAIKHMKILLKSEPRQFVFHNYLAQFHHRGRNPASSILHYNESLNLNAKQPDVFYRLATIHVEQGQIYEAIDCWNRALLLRPDWPIVLNNLAWLRAAHPNPQLRDPSRAIQLATRACDITQYKDPSVLDTLAVAYAADGQFDKAVDTARMALSLLAEEPANGALRKQIEARLALFSQRQAYIDR